MAFGRPFVVSHLARLRRTLCRSDAAEPFGGIDPVHVSVTALDDWRFGGRSSYFAPLQPVRVAVHGAQRAGRVAVSLADGRGTVYAAAHVQPRGGQGHLETRVRGALGRHTVKAMPESHDAPMVTHGFHVRAETRVVTGEEAFDSFIPRIQALMLGNVAALFVRGTLVKAYGLAGSREIRLRDHALQMKACKYWEPDMRSAVDHFCTAQLPDGSFYDRIRCPGPGQALDTAYHWRARCDSDSGVEYWRPTVAADVEYLAVEAAHTAWQATGDDEWLHDRLPALEKALSYCMTDPQRWSARYELLKRGLTIDASDFELGKPVQLPDGRCVPRTEIDEHTRFGIMHGDNTGMHRACCLLAAMFRHCGLPQKAAEWEQKGQHFSRRVNEVCWGGRFYRHRVHIDPVRLEGVDEDEQLSLSNACSLNRGTMTHEMAASVIDEYRRRAELRRDTHAAEWFSIDPAFPAGALGTADLRPGVSVNGGTMPLVGGELARGAFEHGFEPYGAGILRRYYEMMASSNAAYLWYHPDGTPPDDDEAVPTDGPGAAAMLCAFVEGLCGVEDESRLFEHVRLSPRWPAAGVSRALVCAKYGASDGYICYDYAYDESKGELRLELAGSGASARGHLLLPDGLAGAAVEAGGGTVEVRECSVNAARYVDFELHTIPRCIIVSG